MNRIARILTGIIGIGLAVTLVWLVRVRDEPTLPHYPNASLIHEAPYQRMQFSGAFIKTLTFVSDDPPEVVRQWYLVTMSQQDTWFDSYRGYTLEADFVYGNRFYLEDDRSDYVFGITIESEGTGSRIILQLAK